MILSAQSIRRRRMIEPFYERTRQSETHLNMSFGLGPAGYDLRIAEDILLAPGGFTLASSLEHFMFPADVQGELKDKSSWARRGLTVQNTVFDPGFRGFPTLELANHSAEEIRIRYGTAIAQMIFHLLDEPTESPYDGKYQDQQAGPQPAR